MPTMRLMVGTGWKSSMPFLSEYGFEIEAGDTKLIWDADQEAEVNNARRTFNDLRKRGFTAFSVAPGGGQGERVNEFSPEAESLILVPALAGGSERG